MFNVDKVEQVEFHSYDQAYDYISSRQYDDLVITANEMTINENSVTITGQEYPMWETFVDSLFAITKLPRKNEEVLPMENVVNDLNTVFQANPGAAYVVRLMNGKAYSLFKSGGKGIKKNLNHTEFLETLADSTNVENVQKIVLTPKFLRVTLADDQNIVNGADDDSYKVGVDVINGEIYKSLPITIGTYLHRNSTDAGLISPVEDGYVKINPSENPEILKKRILKRMSNFEGNNNLTNERFERLNATPLNQEVMRYLNSGLKCLPVESREHIFAPYFEQDVDGRMTNHVKKDAIADKNLYCVMTEILEEIKRNEDIDHHSRYKSEVFLGQLLNEYNRRLNDAVKE